MNKVINARKRFEQKRKDDFDKKADKAVDEFMSIYAQAAKMGKFRVCY